MRNPLNASGTAIALVTLPIAIYHTVPFLMKFVSLTTDFIEQAPPGNLAALAINIIVAGVVVHDVRRIMRKDGEL